MKKYILIPIIIALIGCSSVKVTTDYDRTADFSKYKTYAFTEESLEMGVNQLNRDRIIKAVENEMAAKGFEMVKDPDIAVDVHIKGQQVQTATATTTGGGYGPWRYGYGGGFSTTTVNYDSYVQGTMFISFIDMATEKIVWQSTGSKPIDDNMSPEKREQSINYVVSQILAKYPPELNK